jgi:peptidoglycan biosynthesis protein MviN/MurJ (putative lipid II flippase)
MTNFLMLYAMMRRYAGRLETGVMIKTVAKLLLAGALLALICLAARRYVPFFGDGATNWQRALGLLPTIGGGAGVFFGMAYLLHVEEVRDVVVLVRGKLGRKS